MNILIENINSIILDGNVNNIIKTIKGEFTKDDLVRDLNNLYYQKVIIDITAIKNYFEYEYLFDFLSFFDKNKVIILLNNDEYINSSFISKLVENGYYNFTKNIQGVNYLIDHPNSLNNVEKYLVNNTMVNPLYSNNQVKEVNNVIIENKIDNSNQIIIGIQNLTLHAGSTTLMYMMLKSLKNSYDAVGIELLKQDSLYFNDSNILLSYSIDEVKMKIKSLNNKDIIIIDLNGVDGNEFCDMILYLIEPGIIKLNKLVKSNQNFDYLSKKGKFILNRSSLKEYDIKNLEYEMKINIFYNLININDRDDKNSSIIELLKKLGFTVK